MKHIVVGGILPRTKKNTEKYNKELNSICRQENIYFVNHAENFLLKNGKIVNGLLLALLRRFPSTNAEGNHNAPNDALDCIDLGSSNKV
jgi:putative N-acetylmannosamine-6-phosphate epimerase